MPVGPVGCGVWKGIMLVEEEFFERVKFKVNKGNRVRFWQDVWCSREPLQSLFPSCFGLAIAKQGAVKDFVIHSRVFSSWDLKPKRNLND